MDNHNYPPGADNKDAPWNKKDNPERELEVLVSVTIEKIVKIRTSDYKVIDSYKDEDDHYCEAIYYPIEGLKKSVKEQTVLPQEAYKHINVKDSDNSKIINDLTGWNEIEFNVFL